MILVDRTHPDLSIYLIEDSPNWKDIHPDAKEEIPNKFLFQKVQSIR
jgi:hypothetical protein